MDDLKIRQKCEDMIAYGYVAVRQFPKTERHVLAQEIRVTMWSERVLAEAAEAVEAD